MRTPAGAVKEIIERARAKTARLCAEHCPSGAIEMRRTERETRPYWTFRCESCMRCMPYCPAQAVEASHLLAVGFYWLTGVVPAAAALAWMSAHVPLLSPLRHVPRWIVSWICVLGIMSCAYPLFHRLLKARPLNWFFTHTTLTHVYRRYHEPMTTLKKLDRREEWTLRT